MTTTALDLIPANRTLVPNAHISGILQHESKYLHSFFNKLAEADIYTLTDLHKYTEDELFSLAPTSKANRERFMSYLRRGAIYIKPSP